MVGMAFVVPAAFFWKKGWIQKQHKPAIVGLAALIGFQVSCFSSVAHSQGALGWYMVKSGLDVCITQSLF